MTWRCPKCKWTNAAQDWNCGRRSCNFSWSDESDTGYKANQSDGYNKAGGADNASRRSQPPQTRKQMASKPKSEPASSQSQQSRTNKQTTSSEEGAIKVGKDLLEMLDEIPSITIREAKAISTKDFKWTEPPAELTQRRAFEQSIIKRLKTLHQCIKGLKAASRDWSTERWELALLKATLLHMKPKSVQLFRALAGVQQAQGGV